MIAAHKTDNVLLHRMHKEFLPIYKKDKQSEVKQTKECGRKERQTASLQGRISKWPISLWKGAQSQ